MSLQDPISDMLVRIKNAQAVDKKTVSMPKSKIKIAIAQVLLDEGYILGFSENDVDGKPSMNIELKYFEGQPVIRRLERASRPGLRVYKEKDQLPQVDNGLGIAIVSTSKGLMTAAEARRLGCGGEIICLVG